MGKNSKNKQFPKNQKNPKSKQKTKLQKQKNFKEVPTSFKKPKKKNSKTQKKTQKLKKQTISKKSKKPKIKTKTKTQKKQRRTQHQQDVSFRKKNIIATSLNSITERSAHLKKTNKKILSLQMEVPTQKYIKLLYYIFVHFYLYIIKTKQ